MRIWVLLSGRPVFVVSPLRLFLYKTGRSLRCWRSNSVFAPFYLCDVNYVMEGLRSLGPIVAAGLVLP